MKDIKVSVIIPTYNDVKHLVDSIDSALAQSTKDLEIIVVDDGSTDSTKDVLKSYIESNKITYLYQNNNGASSARNNGIKISNGVYIAFLDSDDVWLNKDKIEKQLKFLDDNPEYILIGTSGVVADENKNVITNYDVPETDLSIRKSILLKNPFILSSVLARKNILNKVGLFFIKKYVNPEDYSLWLRMGLEGKFFNLKESMVMYSFRDGNISSNNKRDILKSNISLLREYKNKYPDYKKALVFAHLKFIAYTSLSLILNKKMKDKIMVFLFKKYRILNPIN